MTKENNKWEKQIRHQIEIEHDSNKGRFSETFFESICDIIRQNFLSKEEVREKIEGMKKDVGLSPLSQFGVGAIAQDIQLREIGYISKYDANYEFNQALSDLLKALNL